MPGPGPGPPRVPLPGEALSCLAGSPVSRGSGSKGPQWELGEGVRFVSGGVPSSLAGGVVSGNNLACVEAGAEQPWLGAAGGQCLLPQLAVWHAATPAHIWHVWRELTPSSPVPLHPLLTHREKSSGLALSPLGQCLQEPQQVPRAFQGGVSGSVIPRDHRRLDWGELPFAR